MSVRLRERRLEAQASALGLSADRLEVVRWIAFFAWSSYRPWKWLPHGLRLRLFGRLGGRVLRREIERELQAGNG